jgi:hypothetical protein
MVGGRAVLALKRIFLNCLKIWEFCKPAGGEGLCWVVVRQIFPGAARAVLHCQVFVCQAGFARGHVHSVDAAASCVMGLE